MYTIGIFGRDRRARSTERNACGCGKAAQAQELERR